MTPIAAEISDAMSLYQTNPTDQNAWAVALLLKGMVYQHAARVMKSVPKSVDLGDIVSVGLEAAFRSVPRYQDGHDTTFATFAGHRIRGAILDYLRSLDVTRYQRRRLNLVNKALERASAIAGRPVGVRELALLADADAEAIEALHVAARCATGPADAVSLATTVGQSDGRARSLQGSIVNPSAKDPSEIVAKAASFEELLALVQPGRHRTILQLYFGEGLNQDEIGAALGICASRVSQLLTEAKRILRGKLLSEQEA